MLLGINPHTLRARMRNRALIGAASAVLEPAQAIPADKLRHGGFFKALPGLIQNAAGDLVHAEAFVQQDQRSIGLAAIFFDIVYMAVPDQLDDEANHRDIRRGYEWLEFGGGAMLFGAFPLQPPVRMRFKPFATTGSGMPPTSSVLRPRSNWLTSAASGE